MSASPYTCILWDVDGTIADASAGILPRLRQVYASYGLPEPDAQELSLWIGPPMLESFQKWAGMDIDQAHEAVGRYRALAAESGYAAAVDIYPGVTDVLQAVHAAGVPQATASTKPENQVQAILDHYELTPLFTAISGARVGNNTDGKSFVISQALERLRAAGVDTSRPVLIGDRHHDIDGAAEHGIPVIFSSWGFGEAHESEGAIATASAAADLPGLLLR